MTLQTILNRLQKLHPKEIDLSLDRVKNLCKKLGNPQKDLKTEISLLLSILLKKDNAVNEKHIDETSNNIEPLTKAAS